jgi:hypothetical protein
LSGRRRTTISRTGLTVLIGLTGAIATVHSEYKAAVDGRFITVTVSTCFIRIVRARLTIGTNIQHTIIHYTILVIVKTITYFWRGRVVGWLTPESLSSSSDVLRVSHPFNDLLVGDEEHSIESGSIIKEILQHLNTCCVSH